MDVGKSGNNTRRYIDITTLATTLGQDMCEALPAFHAFIGLIIQLRFSRKETETVGTHGEGDFVTTFGKLGDSETVPPAVIANLESFVCSMYGKPQMVSTNAARLSIFWDQCVGAENTTHKYSTCSCDLERCEQTKTPAHGSLKTMGGNWWTRNMN